jgi:uncharacterized SAM-binding protein YcdF (DUF218 family)
VSLSSLVLPVAFVIALVLSIRHDPRFTGNAYLLSITVIAVLLALVGDTNNPAGPVLGGALLLLALLSPLLVLVLIGFLIANGVVMLRKEGTSLGNLLSLLVGSGMLAVIIGAVASLTIADRFPWVFAVLAFVMLLGAWGGYVLTSYLVYNVVYTWITSRTRSTYARYVMVHGSGLIRGRVPRLLANRVDTGIKHWSNLREHHPDALLVLSGGQGPDEPRSEAAAMAEYALEHGVPQEAIVLEDRSRTTEENLRNTMEMVGTVLPADGPGLTVTSSYHVLRTAA